MKTKYFLVVVSLALFFGFREITFCSENSKHNSFKKPTTRNAYATINANNISTIVKNSGSFNRNAITGNSGFEWPKGSGKFANYASGIWVGAIDSLTDSVRVAVAEYSEEYVPGPIAPAINYDDTIWKVYKISKGDNESNNPDYANWPVQYGAPWIDVNHNGIWDPGTDKPELVGDQTLWCVFNDNDSDAHTNMGTKPLGIEVQLTAFAYNQSGALGNMIFYKWKLINKGGRKLKDAYISIWTDADVGDASDDYNGCDTVLGLGYTYNDAYDNIYGSAPPATGFDFFQGPIVPSFGDTAYVSGRRIPNYKNLKMTSYVKYNNGGCNECDPQNGQEVYNYMQARYRNGIKITDPWGIPVDFMLSGDPNLSFTPTNWIEISSPADVRFMMSSGPFTMAAGDTQEIVTANLIASGLTNTLSVTALKQADLFAQQIYDENFNYLPPSVVTETQFISNTLTKIKVVADARSVNASNVTAYFKKYDGTIISLDQLYDDGVHYDSLAGDKIFGSWIPVIRQDSGLCLDIEVTYSDAKVKIWSQMVTEIATTGPVTASSALIVSDNYNNNGIANPCEQIRYTFSVNNESAFNLRDLKIDVLPNAEQKNLIIGDLNSLTSYSMSYDPNDWDSYYDLIVPCDTVSYQKILVVITDLSYNKWTDTLQFPVVSHTEPFYGTPLYHTNGVSDWGLSSLVVYPSSTKSHLYEVTVVDSVDTNYNQGLTLKDLDTGNYLFAATPHYNFDNGHNVLLTDGFKITAGDNFNRYGLRSDSTRWISPYDPWFVGYRYNADPYYAFNGGVTTGSQLFNYLGHMNPTFNYRKSFPVEIRFDVSNTQKAYRLRRSGPANGYMIQATNSFIDVPFTVWDVSNPTIPRQLTIGWRDQNNNSLWDPNQVDDGVEVIFIYNKNYDPTGTTQFAMPPGEIEDETTIGSNADIVYGVSLRVRDGHILNENPGTLYIFPWRRLTSADRFILNPQLTISVTQGWNLISVPAELKEYRRWAVLPGPGNSNTFMYDNGYVRRDTLENGLGYWFKFANIKNCYPIYGEPIFCDTFTLKSGWNLMGSISYAVPINSIVTDPAEIIASNFYGYEAGYSMEDTIKVGEGYWVKVSQAGQFILNKDIPPMKLNSQKEKFSQLNCLKVRDAFGNEQTLYFGLNDNDLEKDFYELPPIPPIGIFDVRFSSQRILETVGLKNIKEVSVDILSAEYPLSVSWEIKTLKHSVVLIIAGKEKELNSSGSIQVSNSKTKISLVLKGFSNFPAEYKLEQNYPNPFNPATTIKYQLPVNSRVVIKIYNLLGQDVKALADEIQTAGYKSVEWKSTNNYGNKLASGVYFFRIDATSVSKPSQTFTQVKKMVLLR